jgi:hypothetical protein
MDAQRAVAWMVVGSLGRRAVFIDLARAEQQAVALHGVLVPLVPRDGMPSEPEPNGGRDAPAA